MHVCTKLTTRKYCEREFWKIEFHRSEHLCCDKQDLQPGSHKFHLNFTQIVPCYFVFTRLHFTHFTMMWLLQVRWFLGLTCGAQAFGILSTERYSTYLGYSFSNDLRWSEELLAFDNTSGIFPRGDRVLSISVDLGWYIPVIPVILAWGPYPPITSTSCRLPSQLLAGGETWRKDRKKKFDNLHYGMDVFRFQK